MSYRLAHRGHDDQGLFLDGPVGLAHNRLSIIDLAGGHQPIVTRETGCALVVNGEIYNYKELNQELVSLGHCFNSHSDSETILHAYAEWGMDFLRRLRGMFSFALYDKANCRLILARDRLGIKPLYVFRSADRVMFASELKALLPYIPAPEMVPEALTQYLGCGYSSGRETLLRGIHRVLPGQAIVVERDLRERTVDYWRLQALVPRQTSYDDLAEEFNALMDQVMREHLRTDVPFGLFLSGGVDSSLLLALIARHQERPVRTFSVGFADTATELPAAETSASLFSTQHTSLVLDGDALIRRLPHAIWANDDLLLDYAVLPTSVLAEVAGKECKVIFTGEGGDEVFAGYGCYRRPAIARALQAIFSPATSGFRARSHWSRTRSQKVFSTRLFIARHAQKAALALAWQSASPAWTTLMRSQYTDIKTMLADRLCPKIDRTLMAFGVEGRVPWLDHRVVEFGLSLPDHLKIAPHQGKLFLKRWGQQFFPADYLNKPKRGFSVPVRRFLSGSLLDELAVRLPRNSTIRQWFDLDGVEWLLNQQRNSGKTTHEVWALLQIALWHRIFVEGQGVAPSPESHLLDWL